MSICTFVCTALASNWLFCLLIIWHFNVLYYCGVVNRCFFLQTVTNCGLRSRPYGDKRHVSIGQHLSKTGRSSTVACFGHTLVNHWSMVDVPSFYANLCDDCDVL